MYAVNPNFKQPSDENQKVWRYMDFTKLISLLESSSLYFARADKFEDPFEGSYPKEDILAVEDYLNSLKDATEKKKKLYRELWCDSNDLFKKSAFLNCWHLNNHESAAMWKLYLKSNEGIAIQSTYHSLKNAFVSEEKIYLGEVKYIDYETEWLGFPRDGLKPLIHKRKSFDHEKEVRAVVVRNFFENLDKINSNMEEEVNITHGFHIPINLDVLIEKIYVAPNAETWFFDIVKSIIRRYDKSYTVIQSDLYQSPLY